MPRKPAPVDDASAPCPCGQRLAYVDCCGRWHGGELYLRAPTAQALMRSRYSAYVLGLQGYLLDTWHPRTRPAGIEADPAGLRWLGLELRRCTDIATDQATVEFIARSKLGGHAHRLHEISRFERIGPRWFYVDALS